MDEATVPVAVSRSSGSGGLRRLDLRREGLAPKHPETYLRPTSRVRRFRLAIDDSGSYDVLHVDLELPEGLQL